LKSKFTQSILESMRAAPVAWAGAAAVALLPFVVLAFKHTSTSSAVKVQASGTEAITAGESSVGNSASSTSNGESNGANNSTNANNSSWFSGADNPFLTEEQSRERRLQISVARVEQVLRRRPDVRDVTVLATGVAPITNAGFANSFLAGLANDKAQNENRAAPFTAVVTIRMREGVVPVALVDATGTLLAAAVPGCKPQDVTVIDESTGIRARAMGLDEAQSAQGRQALIAAQAVALTQKPVVTAPVETKIAGKNTGQSITLDSSLLLWIAGFAVALAAMVVIYFMRTRSHGALDVQQATADDPITGTLSMAFHRSVAEQSAFISTALVERLEQQGTSANEVAQLLLSLEPWAAERLLKGMPPASLAKVEEALRDPTADAPSNSVRALAEAVLSVRAAA